MEWTDSILLQAIIIGIFYKNNLCIYCFRIRVWQTRHDNLFIRDKTADYYTTWLSHTVQW